jgi:hypothetical protein
MLVNTLKYLAKRNSEMVHIKQPLETEHKYD